MNTKDNSVDGIVWVILGALLVGIVLAFSAFVMAR